MESFLERNPPPCLAHDLEALKKGVEERPHLLDCLCVESHGSSGTAEVNGAMFKWMGI